MESEISNLECYVVYSPTSKPVRVRHKCPLPRPFPPMLTVFAISSSSVYKDLEMKAVIRNHDNREHHLEIGKISHKNRAFCWQPSDSEGFTIPEKHHHSYHLHIGTEADLAELIGPAKETTIPDEEMMSESSQTESQEITTREMLPEADRLSMTLASPRLSRSHDKISANEETPQTQVQGTPSRPPHLSHSASKKRKAKHDGEGDDDAGTPPSTRKRQSSRQRPSPSTTLSSPLSSKSVNVEKKAAATPTQKRLQAPVSKKDSDSEPSARWGHTLCHVGAERSLLIGGQGYRQTISRDAIWLLNTETGVWSVPPIVASSDKFPSRMGHTANFDPDLQHVFVFGGSKNLRWYKDMHILDLNTWKWSLIEAVGIAPTRAYHSATFFRNELYIFGGVYPNPDPQPDGCSNDVFIFNPESESWYQPVTMGTKPKPRSGHSATLLGDRLVLFGGWDAPVCYNDLHVLDLCLMEFTSPTVTGNPPSPRSWHASIALPGNRVLIHGGYNGNEALSDAFIFNLDDLTWTPAELTSSVPTGIRAGHAITHYRGTGKTGKENASHERTLAVFGGGDNEDNFFGDLIPFALR